MEHFNFLSNQTKDELFYIKPIEFSLKDKRKILSVGLGATMYSPGTNTKIADKVKDKSFKGLTSLVLCLEDAIKETDVKKAERNIISQFKKMELYVENHVLSEKDIPLIFIRIRDKRQLKIFVEKYIEDLINLKYLAGFSLPKFSSKNASDFLNIIKQLNGMRKNKKLTKFYGMPILESKEIIFKETRIDELLALKKIIQEYEDVVLNIRIGGTDFSSHFGIRRGVDFSIYDIGVVNDCIVDINNILGRASFEFNISGVVWEYFSDHKRMLKPQLRETPFKTQGYSGQQKRRDIISNELDGLIKEVILDKANGFIGKTVIHPTHIKIVNAIHVVTYEEYQDAKAIIDADGGVLKSTNGNKMNEIKPHFNWAKKIIEKSKVYGVLNKNGKYIDLF